MTVRSPTILLFALAGLYLAADALTTHAQESLRPSGEPVLASGWATKCTSEGRREVLDCTVEQTLILSKTQQQFLSIVVRVPADTGEPGMMIHLPFGLFLPAGITLELDEHKPQQLEVQTCESKGCYAGTAVSSDMLAAMKKGRRLTITFQNLSKNKITVTAPLDGFAVAYEKIQ